MPVSVQGFWIQLDAQDDTGIDERAAVDFVASALEFTDPVKIFVKMSFFNRQRR